MSFRVFKGNVLSEDGWRMCNEDECNWITVQGTDVSLQIRKGIPTTILGAFAARFNETVEKLRDADSACWTLDNDVDTSNHPAGTAMDLNWDSHPFHAQGTFEDRLPKLRALLDEFEGCVWWGGDWQDPIDEMHFQLNYREGYLDDNGNFVLDVDPRLVNLAAKLTAAQPKDPKGYAVQLIITEAEKNNYTPDETIAEISTGIQESGLDQNATDSTGHRGVYQEDGGYPHRETVEGNIADHFDRMAVKRASPGASQDIWKNIFWLQQRPGEPSADAAYANGRQHYLTEIQSHIAEATELYHKYAGTQPPTPQPPPTGEVMFTQLDSDRLAQVWGALFNKVPSLSRYGDPNDVWATKDFIRNDDSFLYDLIIEHDAALGDPAALARVRKAAQAGDTIAQHFLDKLSMPNVLPPSVIGNSPGTLPNDVQCPICGKRYPGVLEKCPFCGAQQPTFTTLPPTPDPTPVPTPVPPTPIPPAPQPIPVPSVEIPAPVEDHQDHVHTPMSVIPTSIGGVDPTVVEQLLVLQSFKAELPPELAKAVDFLVPILQSWVTKGTQS